MKAFYHNFIDVCAVVWLFCNYVSCLPSKLTPDEIENIVSAHNLYRRSTNPPSRDMRALRWSKDIASIAQKKAENCKYSHGTPVFHSTLGKLGENIYITEGLLPTKYDQIMTSDKEFGVERSVWKWNQEQKYFNYNESSCQHAKHCGHYTQVVWANSFLLGCGKTFCPGKVVIPELDHKVVTGATVVFCMYSPAGNVQKGFLFKRKKAQPYHAGDRCSKCPKQAPTCFEKLCVSDHPENLLSRFPYKPTDKLNSSDEEATITKIFNFNATQSGDGAISENALTKGTSATSLHKTMKSFTSAIPTIFTSEQFRSRLHSNKHTTREAVFDVSTAPDVTSYSSPAFVGGNSAKINVFSYFCAFVCFSVWICLL